MWQHAAAVGSNLLALCCTRPALRWSSPTDALRLTEESVTFSEDDPSSGGDRDLRIVSYNVWGHLLVGGLHRRRRLAAIAEHIAQQRYDVVCLQELFVLRVFCLLYTHDFDFFRDEMRRIGLVHCSDPSRSLPSVVGMNNGVVVFSRLPFEAPPTTANFTMSHEKPFNKKGFVHVQVAAPDSGAVLHIAATHLDRHAPAVKRQQMTQLAGALQAVRGGDAVVIVAGDFNTDNTSPNYQALRDLFIEMDDPFAPPPREASPSCPAPTNDKGETVDHALLYVPPGQYHLHSARVVDLRLDGSVAEVRPGRARGAAGSASDHFALELVLTPTKTTSPGATIL